MNPLNHAQARQYLQDAADGRLEASKRTLLDEHLAACEECRQRANSIDRLEKNLRTLFHKQWDAAGERSINLLPGIRTRYRRKLARKQLLNLAET